MSDMNFENLPSTSTPITAENLNKLNDVKVSPTEPVTDRRKVWMKKGKNVFNAYQYSYYLRNSSESYVINSANSISVSGSNMSWSRVGVTIRNLLPNTKYTISANVSNPSGHWCGLVVPQGENELNNVSNVIPFDPKITFTSSNNGTITINFFSNWSSSSLTETVVFNQIQLEQGENKTTYEAYAEPSIYIKNDNDVYEDYEANANWIKVGITINESECNNSRTFLYVNEALRMAILQVYYNKTAITDTNPIITIPTKYIPIQGGDNNWFVGTHSNGGSQTSRFTITNNGRIGIVSNTASNYQFGRITYNF